MLGERVTLLLATLLFRLCRVVAVRAAGDDPVHAGRSRSGWSCGRRVHVVAQAAGEARVVAPPNKRLKLTGARVRRIAFPRLRARSADQPPCAREPCARSLSAIR